MRFGLDLGLTAGVAAELVPVVASVYSDVYPEIAAGEADIVAVIAKEEKLFARTLRKGLSMVRRLGRTQPAITGAHLFELHDTFGMPIELSVEEAHRQGIALEETWQADFDALMDAQKARSRAAG